MVIALIFIWSYLSVSFLPDEEKKEVTFDSIKEELMKTTEVPLTYGISVSSDFNSNFPVYSSEKDLFSVNSYGISLDYQLYKLLNVYGRVNNTTFKNDNLNTNGISYTIGTFVSYNYKNLYYGKDLFFTYTHLNEYSDFNRLVYVPRLGYISSSKKFKIWGGLTIAYQDQSFDLDGHFLFVPTMGIEYKFSPSLYTQLEVYSQGEDEFSGTVFKVTYRF